METEPAYGARPHELTGLSGRARSRLKALHLLMQMGWSYLTPEEAARLRGGRLGSAVLEQVLMDYLRGHCRFSFKGAIHPFTENAIQSAVQSLKGFRPAGAPHHDQAYDLLCLGTSVPQTIEGDTKSFTIAYIDWRNPSNNTFHCTTGFKLERIGFQKYYSPDIVLFVNGIPLVVIGCGRPELTWTKQDPVDAVIAQLSEYQAKEGIPQLFFFSQLLLALAGDKARYGTTGTLPEYWSVWKEPGLDNDLRRVMDLSADDEPGRFGEACGTFRSASALSRITEQDRTVYALCRPERLLELTYKFILFDGGAKKIARCQQYFTVQEILKRVLGADEGRKRPGGVVWHTQGSGKSLTMVMLAKSLALQPSIPNPKIILVTDRIDLDDQICSTFRACGFTPEQAATGKHLVELLNDRRMHVVTTLIHKFAAATVNRGLKPVGRNTFVLVDEGHRSQFKERHARMRASLKDACFIAFTGTPIARSAKKNTFATFGEMFLPAYTISRAVQDGAVVPLLYEARHIPQSVDQRAVDDWFEKTTTGLTREHKADLKRKFVTAGRLDKALHKVRMIAWDVSMHYATTYQHSGLKGQLVAPDKETALCYKAFMDTFGMVVSELLISGPAATEGEGRQKPSEDQRAFWQTMMDRYGSEKNYNKQLINAFKFSDRPEIIIVVDKLLTGFDAPCNTVLYLTRKLKEHTLLQAIARVNRLHAGKEHGLILDYSGVIRQLDQAIDFYRQLAEYDAADLEDTVGYVRERIDRLPQLRADVRELFAAVKGAEDPEAYETHLRDDALRGRFYERFGLFARTLALALSSTSFILTVKDKTIRQYKADLKFFQNLRATVSRRYQESIDFSVFEPRIKKLIDTHVGAGEVAQLCRPINLLDAAQRAQVLDDESKSPWAKAEMIAAATRHVIELEMGKDPAFYRKFSEILEEMIHAGHAGRLQALEALEKVTDIAVKVTTHTDENVPQELVGRNMARCYYSCVREAPPAYGPIDPQVWVRIALLISERLPKHKIRDWRTNPDAINKMRGEIDDILFDVTRAAGIDISLEDQDAIIDRCIEVAIANEE